MSSPADIRGAVPLLLTVNAGYVDTAGFLALQGLFTAHVTGNFVTLGASLVLGTSGGVAKLLALPVFCAVVIVTRLLSSALLRRHRPALRIVLGLKVILLVVGAVLQPSSAPSPMATPGRRCSPACRPTCSSLRSDAPPRRFSMPISAHGAFCCRHSWEPLRYCCIPPSELTKLLTKAYFAPRAGNYQLQVATFSATT